MDELIPVAERARTLENADQLAGALDLYLEAVESQPDPVLWNRIGDLQRRTGSSSAAGESYKRSADLFVERGLCNNAIAICLKALQLHPERSALLLDLARIAAQLGYLSDARGWFQEYAERMEQEGDAEAAFEALRAHGEYFPGDIALRRALVDRLLAYDRAADAVRELRSIREWLASQGRDEEARDVWAEISALDPNAEEPEPRLSPAPDADDVPPQSAARIPELIGFEPAHAEDDSDELATPTSDFLPTTSEQSGSPERDVVPLEGLEQTAAEVDAAEALPLDALEATAAADSGDPLPVLEPDDGPVVMRFGDEFDSAEADPQPPLPQLGGLQTDQPIDQDIEEDEGGEDDPLPLLAPEDSLDERESGRAESTAGETLAAPAAAPPQTTVARLQARVEAAAAAGDRAQLLASYLALARHFSSSGEGAKAEVVYRSMLEIEPEQDQARAALAASSPDGKPATSNDSEKPERHDDGFVNLGDLVLNDEKPRELTRFQVAVDDPSGDEDKDFEEILNLFRQQVAIHIDPADAASHYDLGVAFKEMGLLDDAILQFQAALRGGANLLGTLELLGECFAAKGEHSLATRVLARATQIQSASEGDLLGVYYLLGRSEEILGHHREAESCFERVIAIDLGFRDAAARLDAIRRFSAR